MREPLRLWDGSRQAGRLVWVEGQAIRCQDGILAVWNPNREVWRAVPEPATRVQAAVLAAFLAQAAPRSPQEAAAFLDAHLGRLVSLRDSEIPG